jgi:hypothetical protein
MVENLWSFEDFSPSSGMFLVTMNAAKSAQNCQNVPKCAQRQNFEIPPKIEILVFFKKKKILLVEEALEHVSTIWIFNPRIFHMLFLLSTNGLCM